MGDVGSGAVGFIIFALTALVWLVDATALWAALLLSSSVAVDATLTLLSRMRGGRRWYSAHRDTCTSGWSGGVMVTPASAATTWPGTCAWWPRWPRPRWPGLAWPRYAACWVMPWLRSPGWRVSGRYCVPWLMAEQKDGLSHICDRCLI